MRDLLKALVETPCVPQFQDRMLELIRSRVDFAEVETDGLGNIKLTSKGEGEKSVVLLAHINEIGFAVEYIDDRGFLRFGTGSKVDERTLLGQRLLVHTKKGDVRGVIGAKPPHLLEREEMKKPVKIADMFIDIGAGSREGAEEIGVHIGDQITIEGRLKELPDGRLVGKALDDRAGCAAVLETLRLLSGDGVKAVGLLLAQESSLPRDFDPDLAVAVEATLAGPYPAEKVGIERHELPVELGKGPVLTLQEEGATLSQRVREMLVKASGDAGVELQVEASSRAGVERVNPMKRGVPSAILSLPVKYLRTPCEMVSGRDLEQMVRLLHRLVKNAQG